MNIMYCGDEGVKDGVLVSILSLLKNNVEPLHIYILTIKYENVVPFPEKTAAFLDKIVKNGVKIADFSENNAKNDEKVLKNAQNFTKNDEKRVNLLKKLAKNANPKNFVKVIDATEVFVRNLPEKNMGSYFTPCSMLRLYADKILEIRKLDRILYLDYDVVCRKDITEFYHTDMEGVEAAGVLDIYGRRFYHYHGILTQDYMNSGVMLFNMPECLKTGMFEKAVELCAKRWMMLADQAALNKAILKRKLMERKYNEQNERPDADTVLHHFSNNFKFWPYFRVQKVKPHEVEKVHAILKIHEYDDIMEMYMKLKEYL